MTPRKRLVETSRRRHVEANSNAGMVRCLGPGVEHQFWSKDRVRLRVCPRCTEAIEDVSRIARPVVIPRPRQRVVS